MGKASFDNTVKAEWLEDGRTMRILEEVNFTDSNGKVWTAPVDSLVDGASIPRFFHRVVGSPFVGKYRRATVIHDVYCETKSEPHEKVHAMFNEAMICDEVGTIKRKAMASAVTNFGPKWEC